MCFGRPPRAAALIRCEPVSTGTGLAGYTPAVHMNACWPGGDRQRLWHVGCAFAHAHWVAMVHLYMAKNKKKFVRYHLLSL